MLEVTTNHYLVLSFVLFAIGTFRRRRAQEHDHRADVDRADPQLSVNINLVAFSYQHGNLTGQKIFRSSRSPSPPAKRRSRLGILIAYFRLRETTALDQARDLKG